MQKLFVSMAIMNEVPLYNALTDVKQNAYNSLDYWIVI